MSEKLIKNYGDTWKGFKTEDGKHYKTTHSDFSNIIQHVKNMDEAVNESSAAKRKGYQHVGTIPMALLEDWLIKHNYTMHDFAINAGGEKCKTNPHGGGGVKDKFLKYFLSRDFAKLHNR
jgi:hypothetical protein